jgi:cytochrome P450
MRVSDVMVANIFRDVTAGEIDIGNGLRAEPGVRMVFSTQAIHMYPDNYDDPNRFNAFRFSRPFEDTKELGNESCYNPDPNIHALGIL